MLLVFQLKYIFKIMRALRQQFLTDNQGEKIGVFLPIDEFNKMQEAVERLEELEDIKAYDEAKAHNQEFIPAEQAFKEIEANRKKG